MSHNAKHLRILTRPIQEPTSLEESSEPSWSPRYPEVSTASIAAASTSSNTPTTDDRSFLMSQQLEQITEDLSQISGFVAAAVVNAESGMSLATRSTDSSFAIEIAAAANTEVVRAKNDARRALGLEDSKIEDILITLSTQYHLIRPSAKNPMLFIYLALDRTRANLALARHTLSTAESKLDI